MVGPSTGAWEHTLPHPAAPLAIASQLGAGFHEPLPRACWDFGWRLHDLGMLSQALSSCMSWPCCAQQIMFLCRCLLPVALTSLSSRIISEPLRLGESYRCPTEELFRAEHSKTGFLLASRGLCINLCLLHKEAPLIRDQRYTSPYSGVMTHILGLQFPLKLLGDLYLFLTNYLMSFTQYLILSSENPSQ